MCGPLDRICTMAESTSSWRDVCAAEYEKRKAARGGAVDFASGQTVRTDIVCIFCSGGTL